MEEGAKRAARGLFGLLCIDQPFPYKEIPALTSENFTFKENKKKSQTYPLDKQ